MTPDVLIVGAGVFGLWCARACEAAGLSVAVADAAMPGAGASGGPVGALVPHDPLGWTALKAFQLAGLTTLAAEIAALEAQTGMATGYARIGRLMPLTTAAARERRAQQAPEAALRWGDAGAIVQADARDAGVLAPGAAPHGLMAENLSARIHPPCYLAALRAGLRGPVLEGWRLRSLEHGQAVFDAGRIAAGHVVLAAGWQSFALAGAAGGGVKGQAALLRATLPPGTPLIAGAGLYVVPHGEGAVAVGSTFETSWDHAGPDALLDDVIGRAAALVPALAGAPVLRRWAGVRPRGAGRGPTVGPVPGQPGLSLASGGRGIGLAIAHLVGAAVAAQILGRPPPVPLPPDCEPLSAGTRGPPPAGTTRPAPPA